MPIPLSLASGSRPSSECFHPFGRHHRRLAFSAHPVQATHGVIRLVLQRLDLFLEPRQLILLERAFRGQVAVILAWGAGGGTFEFAPPDSAPARAARFQSRQ